jgi:hypothetical protein
MVIHLINGKPLGTQFHFHSQVVALWIVVNLC